MQIGAYTWPALLPTFMGAWQLDNSEAGGITGIFYAACTLAIAVHSMLGYAGGFIGPLVVGWTLDAMGGMSRAGRGVAFGSAALAVLGGRLAFGYLIGSAGRRE